MLEIEKHSVKIAGARLERVEEVMETNANSRSLGVCLYRVDSVSFDVWVVRLSLSGALPIPVPGKSDKSYSGDHLQVFLVLIVAMTTSPSPIRLLRQTFLSQTFSPRTKRRISFLSTSWLANAREKWMLTAPERVAASRRKGRGRH